MTKKTLKFQTWKLKFSNTNSQTRATQISITSIKTCLIGIKVISYNELADEKQRNELEHNVKLKNYSNKIDDLRKDYSTVNYEMETKVKQNKTLYEDLAKISAELNSKLEEVTTFKEKLSICAAKLGKAEDLLHQKENNVRK